VLILKMCEEVPVATICKDDVLTARDRAEVTLPVVDHDIGVIVVDGAASWRHGDVDEDSDQ
jgi:hypothetical protein